MKFTPKTKEEALTVKLLDKGNYQFEVLKAEQKETSNGSPAINVMLKVWGEDDNTYLVWDMLSEAFDFKLRHFCYAIGHGEMSEKGEFDCELVLNKIGVCKIYIKVDKTGQYPDKNAVADYLLNNDNSVPMRPKKEPSFKDDELPF